MKVYFKHLGHVLLFFLLSVHLGLVLLIFSPTSFLARMNYAEVSLVDEVLIPAEVPSFLNTGDLQVNLSDVFVEDTFSDRLRFKFLEFRRNLFLSPGERLALDLSFLDFGSGVIGMEAASQYYFQKPLMAISDSEWMSLLYFYAIFSDSNRMQDVTP